MRHVRRAMLALLLLTTCVQRLVAQNEPAGPTPGERLATAINSGSVSAVRRVLDEGISPNVLVHGTPALMWAIWDDRYYVARVLVERGADANLANDQDYTPLMAAADMGNVRMVELLLDHRAKVNDVEPTYGMSALQAACESGNEQIFDLLVKHGADVQHIDKYGGNCLEEAAFYGSTAIAERLRAMGLTTRWPLHVACGLGEIETVEKLLAEGAKANTPTDGWKNFPIHFAAGGGHVEVARRLREEGARLDAANVVGATPLHVSAAAGRLKFARWLLEQGVDVNAADSDGNTPLDWATERTYELLQQHGGEHLEYNAGETQPPAQRAAE